MKKKIFRALLVIAVLVLVLSTVVSTACLHSVLNEDLSASLSMQLSLAADTVNALGAQQLSGSDSVRFTLVGSDGTVLYDTAADAATLDNHADRQEIRQALKTGRGSSARYSSTLLQRTLYEAVLLDDGSVLRISTDQLTVGGAIVRLLPMNLLITALAIVMALVVSSRTAGRITAPLLQLDLDHPTRNDTYEELSPILTKLRRQHSEIRSQMELLHRKNEEFEQISSSMGEGLVLLDAAGRVLVMNKSARTVFAVTQEPEGMDFLQLDRTPELSRAIAACETAAVELPKNGRQYRFRISPIVSGDRTVGTLLLIIDITEHVFAERNRQEFTANVSHELKTPLQSIIGSAELLENGLVRAEDMPRFVGNIKSEAVRLVTLIEDIIRLSQLDEKAELPCEQVQLRALADEVVQTLSPAAQKKNVTLTLSGDDVCVSGIRRYLYEVLYNLCDNAIRYNTDGGSVRLDLRQEDSGAVIEVSDTGIGIAPEHRSRIFERFYRVDKSHSRETGGTGLGLAIVKRAVLLHGGAVQLDSTVGKGTTVTVILK